jgi:CRP-like cAMP-binding protein
MERLGTVQLLREEPALLELVPARQQAAAVRAITAAAVRLRPGGWDPHTLMGSSREHFGLLLLDGLMLREVAVANTTCGEVVGPGELLRPWDNFGERAPMPLEIEWKVLEPARIAVLDPVLAAWPALVGAFVHRAIERSHSLALHVAIHCIRRVDVSLLVLFSHLADRFGKVTPAGIVLDLKLTHQDLGKLVGATRQSVSTALADLARREVLARRDNGTWLLSSDSPEEIERMQAKRHRVRQLSQPDLSPS